MSAILQINGVSKSFGGIIDLKTNVDNKNVLNWNGVSCEETCSI